MILYKNLNQSLQAKENPTRTNCHVGLKHHVARLKVETQLHRFRARRHIVRATEGGKEVV
jgi:hypothetical protein